MRPLAVALACSLCGLPAVASADVLSVSSGEASEVVHTVDIEVDSGAAKLRVRRTFVNEGPKTADITVNVDLPLGGVITRLSIDGGEVEAQLLAPREAALHLPKVPSGARRTVEYTIEVPLESQDDRATVWMPEYDEAENLSRPVVRHRSATLTATPNPVWDPYVVNAPTPASGQLRWGAYSLPRGAVWRAELDMPHSLGEQPKGARVVFLVDRSRSQTLRGVQRQLRILAQWASLMPDGKYQAIAYARQAEALFDEPVDAAKLKALQADDRRLAMANGSSLDAALELAAGALGSAKGPAYLVILGDGEVPARLDPRRLRALLAGLPESVTVHLLLSEGRATRGAIETRADEHRLSALALDHGGAPMRVLVLEDYAEPAEALVLVNLLRPRRIDRLVFETNGELESESWRSLQEHAGTDRVAKIDAMPGSVAVSGWLWANRWRLEGTRNEDVDRRAALFATSTLADDDALDGDALDRIGRDLGVVTQKTALAVKKGKTSVVEPSKLDVTAHGGMVGGGVGSGSKPTQRPAEIPRARLLATFGTGIDECVAQYRGPAASVLLSIETSWDEVLDVAVDGGDASTRLCVGESVWGTALDAKYDERHAFGLLEVALPERGDGDDGGEQGPPEIGSGARGCSVGGAHGVALAWPLLVLAAPRRRRRRC